MRRTLLGLAIGLGLLLVLPPTRASAQGLASLAAASATSSAAVEKVGPGCWGCEWANSVQICRGGIVPGYYNCSASVADTCRLTSPGCGAGASLPLDPDGSAQYVSRGSRLGVPVESEAGGTPVRRNCEGVVVARRQSADDISSVRIHTGSLTL
jgi:hypothetical protein